MKIERAVLREAPLMLARPFQTSAGVVHERRVLILTLLGDGLEGWSECVAPSLPNYTYEAKDLAWRVLTEWILPRVPGTEIDDPESVLATASMVRGHPMAKAALEMAAWDMAARSRNVSLSSMLGGTRGRVPVGVSLGMMPVEELVGSVRERIGEGYSRVKVKVGPGRDLTVLSALRERFPGLRLWADANSAYTIEDAARLGDLDELGLEMLEEPLEPGDFVQYSELRRLVETPLCLDESILSAADLAVAVELGSCGVVNIKPGRVGGFASSLRICSAARDAGLAVWCGGMLETGIGRAHNLALASLPDFDLPGDISASSRYWERDIVSPEFDVEDGTMAVPTGPGIGVQIDVERIDALTVRVAEFS